MFVACILICADCKKKKQGDSSKMEAEAERAYWGPGGVSAGLHALQLS